MLVVPLILACVATVTDLRSRTVPNWIPALLLTWALASLIFGLSPTTWLGALLGLALSFTAGGLSFRVGVLGGGDVKFLMALGVALGPLLIIWTLFLTALSGAVLAIVALMRGEKELAYMPAITLALGALTILMRRSFS